MKRILFFISSLLVASMAMAQTPAITNGTFESWVAPSLPYQLERPTAWYGTDEVLNNQVGPLLLLSGVPFTPQKQLYKSADKYEGDYCAKIMTKHFGDSLKNVPALLTNAKQNLNIAALMQAQSSGNVNPYDLFTYTNGTPMYGKKIDSVTAYINAPATNQDTGVAFVLAYGHIRPDSIGVIGQGIVLAPPSANGYTKVKIPVIYTSFGTATDTMVVGFVSAGDAGPNGYFLNNTLFVDKVELFWSAGTAGINPVKTSNLGFKIYPNPAKDYVVFEQKTGLSQVYTLVVYNALGQVMHHEQFRDGQKRLDLNRYADGLYYYELYNAKGTARQTGKFTK
ncbi:hypothetical protein DBR32_04510 [Taibaiella sp. KBW10]|uniref:T9SS type A sorting domain-containing protein n=1 Tax=Taibaiella sp. KBW10 TaxID=2153357 RepID=UPI000F5970E2|nr:T9SS type A sorting domain-containing protein [Taibaiella sp. KBW10]RQO31237.1 hypothetical protein DBR32_04510 [Taibaiella sp. KBW10]